MLSHLNLFELSFPGALLRLSLVIYRMRGGNGPPLSSGSVPPVSLPRGLPGSHHLTHHEPNSALITCTPPPAVWHWRFANMGCCKPDIGTKSVAPNYYKGVGGIRETRNTNGQHDPKEKVVTHALPTINCAEAVCS